ncbi:unnamed protein product [Sphagnum balticum]
MAKNVRQVVNRVVETVVDVPKQEEHKFNLRLTNFKAKEGETEKERTSVVAQHKVVARPNEVAWPRLSPQRDSGLQLCGPPPWW